MSFLQKIIDQVSMEARQKGVKCRGAGKITIAEHTDDWIEAIVECDASYPVTLERERGILFYGCGCNSYLKEGEPCEHVWATLLQAESLGYLRDWESRGAVLMEP